MTKDYQKLSLTEFKRNTAKYLKKIKNNRRPAFLTVNGRVELVVQDARAYQGLLDRIERAETTVGLRQGIEEFNRGEGRQAKKAFDDLRRKHGISR
jgi:PHD/YefM family antitoxin component YafN of YafNO toxin-antitoxin module